MDRRVPAAVAVWRRLLQNLALPVLVLAAARRSVSVRQATPGERAAHFLPAQGPITVFIHHNTLHAFEDDRFDEGVQRGAELLGCQPYLAEERFREMLSRGRI